MRTSFRRFAALALAAVWAVSAAQVSAEDEGFARLTDATFAEDPPYAAPAPLELGPGVCGTAGCPGPCGAAGYCGHDCHAGHGRKCHWCLFGHGRCPGPHDHCCPLTAMLCHGACTHSPDHGWVRPRKFPVHRVPVTYQYYWPARWYGQPGSGFISAYPMVYMPTDTTELGFYYQRVPYWVPKPVMLPPGPPWPPQWHRRDCRIYGYDISPMIGAPGTYGGGFAAADGMFLAGEQPVDESFSEAAATRPVEHAAFGPSREHAE